MTQTSVDERRAPEPAEPRRRLASRPTPGDVTFRALIVSGGVAGAGDHGPRRAVPLWPRAHRAALRRLELLHHGGVESGRRPLRHRCRTARDGADRAHRHRRGAAVGPGHRALHLGVRAGVGAADADQPGRPDGGRPQRCLRPLGLLPAAAGPARGRGHGQWPAALAGDLLRLDPAVPGRAARQADRPQEPAGLRHGLHLVVVHRRTRRRHDGGADRLLGDAGELLAGPAGRAGGCLCPRLDQVGHDPRGRAARSAGAGSSAARCSGSAGRSARPSQCSW